MLLAASAKPQCSIISTSAKVCIGSTALFSPSPVSASDSLYVWNFGDGSTSNQPSPSYQYSTAGTFLVTLRIYSFGGAFCDATPFQVKVLARPIAFYKRLSSYAQCFKGNVFVFADSSKAGLSNAPVSQLTMVFDDGAIVVQQAPFSGTIFHTYTDPAGNKYRIVLEVKDTNGCIAQHIDSVVVHPRMPLLSLNTNQDIQCGFTDVVLNNGGAYNASNTQKITWIMGNGDTLYSPANPFNQVPYRYNSDSGVFYPKVIVQDKNGCIMDTTGNEVICYSLDSSLNISSDKQCFRNNLFSFSNPSTWWHQAYWVFNSDNGTDTTWITGNINNVQRQFVSCGSVNVRMVVTFGGCEVVRDTQVFVYGPKARIAGAISNNTFQCEPHDTIQFRYFDPNCYYKDSGIHFVWNFYDPFAPPCTTDTRRNINVGMNCNYSVDSINVKHFYSQPNPICYYPRLWVIDSINGCHDSISTPVHITAPDAGWDSTVTPVRRGVYYKPGDPLKPCLPLIDFYFDELIPFSCIPEQVWLLPDSTCFPHVWKQVSQFGSPGLYKHDYTNKCAAGSRLTYGVVARNGKDRNGRICYDTAWYPLEILNELHVPVEYKIKNANTCEPFHVVFSVPDSIRKDIALFVCNFGDNSVNYQKQFTQPGDTIIRSFAHTYADGGKYPYVVIATSKSGCVSEFFDTLYMGKKIALLNALPDVCEYDSAYLLAFPAYNEPGSPDFWGDTLRAAQGKESIFWNFGDDPAWYKGGREMKHKYTKAGFYQVSVAYKDSTPEGCYDTIVDPSMLVRVSRVDKKIIMANDTFFCAPTIIHYIDSSRVIFNDTLSADTFESRVWNFGPDRPQSTLQNPSVYYPLNGIYQTRLTLKTFQGCTVDTMINVAIVGPDPEFVIANDTVGCAPFTVKLRNETGKQLVNWIWYFNDPLNQIFSTSSDTDITFTYTTPGVYHIDLVGEDRIFNTITQSYSNCSQKFPYVDPANGYHSRQVVVLKTDTLRITAPDSVCERQTFIVRAAGTSQVSQVKWNWGDSTFNIRGITENGQHAYDTSGRFRMILQPVITAPTQCVVPAEKDIDVLQPLADFTYDSLAYPKFTFINQSQNAVRYVWDFGQPSSGQNTSADINPVHNYGSENKRFKVCLMAFDVLDCWDSVCKMLPQRSSVIIPNVFTPGNNDGKNDAFDIDIEGWEKYELYIYNRWGTPVYESMMDGFGNDGINWDGRNKNDGEPCPEGVYYIIFKYKLLTANADAVYHGTVTLIRE